MITSLSLIKLITEFLLIFSIGSAAGWWLEFFYRGIVRRGDFINPGFLSGPYLPLYGFGAFFLYVAGQLRWSLLVQVLFFTAAATLMELFTGLFFVRFYQIRLWDYSDRRGNIKGQICPLFTFYWGLIGAAGLILVVPSLVRIVRYFDTHIHYSFFVGLYYGVIFSDVVNSFNVAARLSSVAASLRQKVRSADSGLQESAPPSAGGSEPYFEKNGSRPIPSAFQQYQPERSGVLPYQFQGAG